MIGIRNYGDLFVKNIEYSGDIDQITSCDVDVWLRSSSGQARELRGSFYLFPDDNVEEKVMLFLKTVEDKLCCIAAPDNYDYPDPVEVVEIA